MRHMERGESIVECLIWRGNVVKNEGLQRIEMKR